MGIMRKRRDDRINESGLWFGQVFDPRKEMNSFLSHTIKPIQPFFIRAKTCCEAEVQEVPLKVCICLGCGKRGAEVRKEHAEGEPRVDHDYRQIVVSL